MAEFQLANPPKNADVGKETEIIEIVPQKAPVKKPVKEPAKT